MSKQYSKTSVGDQSDFKLNSIMIKTQSMIREPYSQYCKDFNKKLDPGELNLTRGDRFKITLKELKASNNHKDRKKIFLNKIIKK
jgi:hypothetical protein